MDARHEQLLSAIAAHDFVRVHTLVTEGLDLNVRCDQGATPLFGAVLVGELDLVRLLLDHGADPNIVAHEPAATVYHERVIDLALGARHLLDWEKYQRIAELLVARGALDADGRVHATHEQRAAALAYQAASARPAWYHAGQTLLRIVLGVALGVAALVLVALAMFLARAAIGP